MNPQGHCTLGHKREIYPKNRKIGHQNQSDFWLWTISRHSGLSKNTIFKSEFGLVPLDFHELNRENTKIEKSNRTPQNAT